MIGLLCFALAVLASAFKSKLRLEAENAVLRHQLIVLRRRLHGRVRLTNHDRWFLIQLYRWFPSILQLLTIIRPETLVRWHRAGFERLWKSVKYEEVYLRAYETVAEARISIGRYLDFYNGRRPHSSLDDRTPDQAYFDLPPLRAAA
jgi:Integrase core domain